MGVEETLAFFKPDGMINKHAQQAFKDYLRIYNLDIKEEKAIRPDENLMRTHYKDLQGRLPDHVIEEIIGYVTGTGKSFKDYHEHLKRTYPDDGIAETFPGHLQAYHIIGDDAVSKVRAFLGPTNPSKTHEDGEPLSLGLKVRPQFGSTYGGGIYNVIHATDKPENAPEELVRFGFTPIYTCKDRKKPKHL